MIEHHAVPNSAPRFVVNHFLYVINQNVVLWNEVDSIDQNGNITQYEVRIIGEFDDTTRIESTDGHTFSVVVSELEQATFYNISVRAHTSVGPGPYSDDVIEKTLGLFIFFLLFFIYMVLYIGFLITDSPQSMNVRISESVTFTCVTRIHPDIFDYVGFDWLFNNTQVRICYDSCIQ